MIATISKNNIYPKFKKLKKWPENCRKMEALMAVRICVKLLIKIETKLEANIATNIAIKIAVKVAKIFALVFLDGSFQNKGLQLLLAIIDD